MWEKVEFEGLRGLAGLVTELFLSAADRSFKGAITDSDVKSVCVEDLEEGLLSLEIVTDETAGDSERVFDLGSLGLDPVAACCGDFTGGNFLKRMSLLVRFEGREGGFATAGRG